MVQHAECGAGGTPGSSTCGSSSRIGRGQREFFLTTLRAVAHVVEFDKALLALGSNGDDHVAVAACAGAGPPPAGSSWCRSAGMVSSILNGGQTVRSASSQELAGLDGGLPLVQAGFLSLHCAPVISRDTAVGALILASRSAAGFDEDQDAFLLEVGRQLGLVLESTADRGGRTCPTCQDRSPVASPRDQGCRQRGSLIVESAAFKAVMATVARVAPTNAPVLLLGESGTGKELVARRFTASAAAAADRWWP